MASNRERIALIEKAHLKSDRPSFRIGDTIQVYVKIQEDEKTRIQMFEGLVTSRKGSGSNETFTVRRVAYGEGMERTFFLHSPFVEKLHVVHSGKVRRAKLYYLRRKIGKGTRIETRWDQTGAPTPSSPSASAQDVRPAIQAPGPSANRGG